MRAQNMEFHLTDKQRDKIKSEKEYYNQTICMGKRKHAKGPNPMSKRKKKTE